MRRWSHRRRELPRGAALPDPARPPLAEGAGQGRREPSQRDGPNLSMAVKVLELLSALDPDKRLRKAPLIKVFLLRFRQNRSR